MAAIATPSAGFPAPSVARSLLAAYRLSLRRLVFSKYMWGNIVFVMVPLMICVMMLLLDKSAGDWPMAEVHKRYETFLHTLYMRFVVFFLAGIFGFAVVRQDMDDQTLHYLFLQPAPRWALFSAKMMAYLTLVWASCVASQWACYALIASGTGNLGTVVEDLFANGRLWTLAQESLVIALALMAYGSVAVLGGSIFKSAMYAVALWFWELILPFLPLVLKQWTLLHYLQSLLPEKPPDMDKMFAMLGDPAGAGVSLIVIGAVSAISFGVAFYIFWERECQYGET